MTADLARGLALGVLIGGAPMMIASPGAPTAAMLTIWLLAIPVVLVLGIWASWKDRRVSAARREMIARSKERSDRLIAYIEGGFKDEDFPYDKAV